MDRSACPSPVLSLVAAIFRWRTLGFVLALFPRYIGIVESYFLIFHLGKQYTSDSSGSSSSSSEGMRFVLVNLSACHIALACVPMHFRHDDAAHSLVAILITALYFLSGGNNK